MNKFIKQQLKKCRTTLPDWDDDTTQMIVSNRGVTSNKVAKSGNLHIFIENYIINEPVNFTLSSNWNGGTKPPENEMIVDIINQTGKMYKVSGFGMTTNQSWTGWLPGKGFRVIDPEKAGH